LPGTARDQEIARKLARSVSAVRSRRLQITRIKFKRTPDTSPLEGQGTPLAWQVAGRGNRPSLESLPFRRTRKANPPRHPVACSIEATESTTRAMKELRRFRCGHPALLQSEMPFDFL
jgi:hypothetical protein